LTSPAVRPAVSVVIAVCAITGRTASANSCPTSSSTLAHRPDEFRAFFAYHDALMEKDVGLTKAEREMIVVATSNANNCLYCVVAHGAILRIRAKNPRSPTSWPPTTARPRSPRASAPCSILP
jgi:AhpD family alkylhydroperoxidase